MRVNSYRMFIAIAGLCLIILAVACTNKSSGEVIVYTSLDQLYSEPIFKEFEKSTGIRVKPVYDTEAAKTTGLVNRLIAESSNPQADVFWNNEIGRTIILKSIGILAPYRSPSAASIPDMYKDPEGYWAGFAARARILICNTDLVPTEEMPRSLAELTAPEWKGQVCIGNPLFGTTATHVAALFEVLGEDSAKSFFKALKQNGVVMVPSNSISRDYVRDGEMKIGFTDTDDANIAIQEGKPVTMIFPDKEGMGTLVIPNTVALIKGARHLREAKLLIDYLLSEEVESKLAYSLSAQIPVRPGVDKPSNVVSLDTITTMDMDWERLAETLATSTEFVHKLFVR